MKPAGIYRFINNRTGEVYVGQSNNVYARKANHFKELSLGTHHNKGLQEDHDRGDTFTFEVLEKMPDATREELEEREIYYIEKFNSFYEGYNQTPGGEYDKYKGYYEHGGDRLPFHKYETVKLLTECPECGGELVKRKGKKGTFAGCSNYPECRFTTSVNKVNFKDKKQTNYVSTKYDPKTYVPPFRSVPCKYCGKLIKNTHTICPFCEGDLNKPSVDPISIEWKTCEYCGKKINKIAKKCPYCNEQLISEPSKKSDKKPLKTEFEKFCTRKNNYLTKTDCEFLAEKFDIDISHVDTVKKSNPIIRNYLNKNNLWDYAMHQLYISTILDTQEKYDNNIVKPVTGNCPKCDGGLIRINKYLIQCENYSGCGFSCSQKYYENKILGLSPETELNSSTKISDSKNLSKTKSEKPDIDKNNSKSISYYDIWNNKLNKQKSHEDSKISSKSISSNTELIKTTNENNLNYCSNCGSKLDSKGLYCWNCGEKIEKGNKLPTSVKRDWGGFFATILIVIFILLFILSLVILCSDVEGPITTIATIIIVAGVCFGCYILGGQS